MVLYFLLAVWVMEVCLLYTSATPILKQVAAVAYRTAKSELNVDTEAFEVSYNGPDQQVRPDQG